MPLSDLTADAIEALNPGTLELLVDIDSFFDVFLNGNEAIDNTDDVRVVYGADTKITIDGFDLGVTGYHCACSRLLQTDCEVVWSIGARVRCYDLEKVLMLDLPASYDCG